MSHRIIFLLIYSFSLTASAIDLPVSEIASRVRLHHPSLKAARLAIDEAKGRQLGSGRLSNPTVGVDFQNESAVSPQALGVSIDQAFPVTGRLRLERKLTSQLVASAELEVREVERQLVVRAMSSAVELLALEQQRELRKRQTKLADELSKFAKSRADAGELSALDAAQAQVDTQRLLLEARRIETQRVGLLGELKPMIGLKPNDALTITGQLPKPSTAVSGSTWQHRADYQLAKRKLEAAGTDSELATARKWEDVTAGVFAAQERQDVGANSTESTGFVGFRVSIPLPFWNRNQGEIAEKKASSTRAQLEVEALETQILAESETAVQEMAANAKLISETTDKLLPLVVEQTTKLEKAYETGQVDLITLLRAREQRLQLEAASLDALRDFHLARIRYEAATGKIAPVSSDSVTAKGSK